VGVVLNAPFPPKQRGRLGNVVRNTFRYLFVDAARNWARNVGSNAPALGSMTLLLLLSGLAGVTAYAMQSLAAQQARDAAVLHVYLRDDAQPPDVEALRAKLAADGRVATVAFTSKGDALRRAQHRPGLPDLVGAADTNPFPASLDVKLRDVRDVGAVAGAVGRGPAIDPILPNSYDRGAYERIQRVLAVLAIAGGVFLLLLGFVAVAVTANSIRAAIFARHQELEIMELVGAPRWMVRGPFLVEGALTGAIAGLIAGVVTLVASLAALAAGASTFAQIAPGISAGVCLVAALVVFLTGLGLGSGASLLSVHRQLQAAS
jgi:cell division transport system permease protein